MIKEDKIVIVGAGHVGSHCALALAGGEVCREIVLVDIHRDKAAAQAADVADALIFPHQSVAVRMGELEECADAAIVIIAVGQPHRMGQTRLDLLEDSVRMVHELVADLRAVGVEGIVITITNPADIIADYVRRGLGMSRAQAFGTGTLLDTMRLARLLCGESGVSPDSIRAYVLGEHGDSAMIPFSAVRIAEADCDAYGIHRERLLQRTRAAGMEIMAGKHSTEFGIAQACAVLCRAILRDEKRVLPLSAQLCGEYGQRDLHAGVPCLVGRGGIETIVELPLAKDEAALFDRSCEVIRRHRDRALEIASPGVRW